VVAPAVALVGDGYRYSVVGERGNGLDRKEAGWIWIRLDKIR